MSRTSQALRASKAARRDALVAESEQGHKTVLREQEVRGERVERESVPRGRIEDHRKIMGDYHHHNGKSARNIGR
jgi:hypothetical protein